MESRQRWWIACPLVCTWIHSLLQQLQSITVCFQSVMFPSILITWNSFTWFTSWILEDFLPPLVRVLPWLSLHVWLAGGTGSSDPNSIGAIWVSTHTKCCALCTCGLRDRSECYTSSQIICCGLRGPSSCTADDVPIPIPCLKGDALSIKIDQDEYSKGLAECQYALRGRFTLTKGDKPYTARDLASKLGKIWKMAHEWKMVSLGRGFYDFLFQHPNDLTRIWAAGSVSRQPGLFSSLLVDERLPSQFT